MKQFNQNFLSSRPKKSAMLILLFLVVSFASIAQVYRANGLAGSKEAPPNASPGTGNAVVTITGTFMRVQATFSGLMAPTTASHIHGPTAVPGTGTAGVATTTPSFPGFPLGVTAGSFDMTYDMMLASSYNPSFITNNGGTPALAFAALKTALNNGAAYFNVHSQAFPGGEIRAFFVLCPTIDVTIPDAYALPEGTLPNTVYPAYAPAASLTLKTSVSGGTGPYSYNWSNGSTASSTVVSPVVPTAYSVMVHDQNGCTGTATKTVNVLDVSSGKKGDKIDVCHKGGNTLSIASPAVSAHIGHGDMLGSCADNPRNGIATELAEVLSVQILNNPSQSYFDLKINSKDGNTVRVRVIDLLGRVMETKEALQPNQTLRIGGAYTPGTYIVEVVQGAEKQVLKLLKVK